MPRTRTEVYIGSFDKSIKQKVYSIGGFGYATSEDDLLWNFIDDRVTYQPMASFEENFWLLSGDCKFLSGSSNIDNFAPYAASVQGTDEYQQTLIYFSSAVSFSGLTLWFMEFHHDIYPTVIRVNDTDYSCTGPVISIDAEFTDITSLSIRLSYPTQATRSRLSRIEFGSILYSFTSENIKSAKVLQSSDPLSAELRINTLELQLFSTSGGLSIFDASNLQKGQSVFVREYSDNVLSLAEEYFIDTWSNESESIVKINAYDKIGLMDKIPQYGGIWIDGISVSDLMEDVLKGGVSTSGSVNFGYFLDPDLYDVTVKGWVPYGTFRNTIQQIAFAIGAYVDCSKDGVLKILKTNLPYDGALPTAVITDDQLIIGKAVERKVFISKAELTVYTYEVDSDAVYQVVFEQSGNPSGGTYTFNPLNLRDGISTSTLTTVLFSSPVSSVSASGTVTVYSSSTNHRTYSYLASGVDVSVKYYLETQGVLSISNADYEDYLNQNVLEITDATLANATNGADIIERVYNYYLQPFTQNARLIAPKAKIGDIVLVNTIHGKQILGTIEEMSIDLTGGFIADAKIVGVEYVMD